MRVWGCLIVSLAAATPAAAEDGLSLAGTTRFRLEAIDGQARAVLNSSDMLVNVRTTLAADFHKGPFQVFAEIWDSRVIGANAGTPVSTSEVNTIEPVQAFVGLDLGHTLGARSELHVQAGRYLLNIGSRRLVAADDYRNTTSGYTGLKVDLTLRNKTDFTLVYVLPQVRLPEDPGALRAGRATLDRESFNLVLWGGLIARRDAVAGATLEGSFFHVGERDAAGRPTRDRSLDTFGARLIRNPKPGLIDFEIEGFFQTGRASATLAADAPVSQVAAGFVHTDVGYSWTTAWHPRLSVEVDWASGDAPGGRATRFDTLFGMRRADFGPSGLYATIGRTNVLTPGVRLEAAPSAKVDVFAVYRTLWLAERTDAFSTAGVRDAAGVAGRFAGHQIEARVRWWLSRGLLRFEANGLVLFKGPFLRNAPNAPRNGNTRYMSLNLTASF
jgi:hypothetical protein